MTPSRAPPKISIVAFHYAPDDAVGSIRPQNWARWLSDRANLTVLTRPAANEPAESGDRIRVLRPRSSGIALVDRLNDARKARRVKAAAQVSPASQPQGSKDGAVSVPSGVFQYRMPCAYDLWLPAILRGLMRESPDIVIATHSPYVSLLGAALYKALRPRTKLWLDFRDLWSKNPYAIGVPVMRSLEGAIERWALRKADLITTVSHGLADELRSEATTAKVVVVHNASEVSVAAGVVAEQVKHEPARRLSFCYTGTIYPGFRDPTPLFELLASLPDADVALTVASRDPGDLFAIARRFNLERVVDYRGRVSREQSITLQNEADILLLLETGDERAKGVLTGKVFEYLETDKPILLLGPGPNSEIHALLKRYNRLVSLDQVRAFLTGKIDRFGAFERVDTAAVARRELFEALDSL